MWKRRVIIGLLLGITLLLAFVILLQTSTFEQWLLRNVETFARNAGVPFSARDLDINWWDLQASLAGFVYDDEKGTRITAERISIDVPWNAFDTDVILIDNLEAQGLVIEVRSPEPVVPEPSGETARLPQIRFGRILIDNGRFSYSNQSTNVEVPSFALDARDGRGTLRVASAVTISPDTRLEIREIPIVMDDASITFGPNAWRLDHAELSANGTNSGNLQWSPALVLNLDYSTDPFTIQEFHDVQSSAKVHFENGILKVTDFQATSGRGNIAGSAEISDKAKSADMSWTDINLDAVGFPALTDGAIGLKWTVSDFSDASGEGSVSVNSRLYGRAESGIRIQDGRATLNLTANAFDANLRANINTGLDQRVSGTFLATHRKYGIANLQGSLSGTIKDPAASARLTVRNAMYNGMGPADASANATLKSMIVSVTDIEASFKGSKAEQGFVRVDLNTENLAGEIPVVTLQLEDFAPDTQGAATLAATISGTIRKPAVRFAGASPGFDVGSTHIDGAAVEGEFIENEVRLTTLTARQAEGQLQASGVANLSTEAVLARLSVTNLNITQVRDLSTTVSLDAEVQGTYRAPIADFMGEFRNLTYQNQAHGDLQVKGSSNGNNLTLNVQSGQYTATAIANLELQEPYPFRAMVTADESRIVYQQYEAVAGGTAGISGQLQPFKAETVEFDNFNVTGEGVNLTVSGDLPAGARIVATSDLSQLPVEGMQLGGSAVIDAVVRGTLEDPQVEGKVETTDATVQAEGMTEPAAIQAVLDFTRDEFQIQQLRATFAEATVTITGAGTVKGAGNFQFRAENIRPERLLRDRPLAGVISVEGSLDVGGPSIDAISGLARVTELDLRVRDVAIHQVEPVELLVQNQVLSVRNLTLEGLNTRATVTGNANLRTRALNFDVNGNTELRILEAIIPGSIASGQVRTNIAIRGNPEQPDLQGFLNVENMQFELSEPPVLLTNTNVEMRFSGERIEITRALGTINGGEFVASGGSGISAGGLRSAAIQLNLTRAQIEYPEGLQSEVSSQLLLEGSSPNLELSGNVDVLNAIYRRDIDLAEEVFTRITTDSTFQQSGGPDAATLSLQDQIRLDVTVGTPGLVSVVNNVASLDLTGDFRVRGTLAEPIILGRATALQGGELYFGPQVGDTGTAANNERRDRYIIEQGSLDFNNPIITEPGFDFVATHELRNKGERTLIRLQVSGTPQDLRTELTSDPEHNEAEIIAMLLTGRTFTELQGASLDIAREQAFNYVSGQLGGFFENAGSALGLDTVRIEPIMLAEEEDVSARLTIGKDITQDFSLVYSQNLSGAKDQSWIATYQTFQNLLIRAVNESASNRTRAELRQELSFGGGPALPARVQPGDEALMGMPTFEGATVPMKDLLKRVTEPGDPFNTYRLNEDLRELEQFYADRDFLDAKIRAERNPRNGEIDIRFVVQEGPRITLAYEGAGVPRKVRNEIRDIWIKGFSEAASLRDSDNRLLRHFRDEGHLQAQITHRNESVDPTSRQFIFRIEPGPEFEDPEFVFHGVDPIEMPQSAGMVLENPTAIKDRIEFDLRKDGFLEATSTLPELVIDGRLARFEVTVERGRLYSVGRITFQGNESLEEDELNAALLSLPAASDRFTSTWLTTARQSLISKYWQNGFNDAQVVPATANDPAASLVHVTFDITEGEQQRIESIRITGNDVTDIGYVTRKFAFKEGDPVDYSRINLTRKQLYDTRLFKRADIEIVRGQGGYLADVKLNENAPWRFRYGFAVANKRQTTDRDLGVTADFSYGNLLGKGILLGTSGKATAAERDGRVFASFPVFFGRDVTTSATVFKTRDLSNWCDDCSRLADSDKFIADRWGFTLQQQWRLKNLYILSYDYGFHYDRTFTPQFDPNDIFGGYFDVTARISRFSGTLSRDSRDDLLNATRGTFFSSSTEIAPPGVGSRLKFIKNYSQYFRFTQIKEKFVWASAVRAGMGRGLAGQQLTEQDQFTAGGATSVRGFKQDELTFLPGNAVFVVNQEFRLPLFWRIGGVGFFDAGNVYPEARNFNPFKLRYSPGVGLRFETPFALIRLDLGFNPWPSSTILEPEPRRHFSFGIGQAF